MSKYSPEFLTKMKREPMSLNYILQAIKDRGILEAQVVKCDSNNTLTLNLGNNITGIIELDELEYNYDGRKTKAVSAISKINKHIKFIPLSVEKQEDKSYIVKCSRKEAQKECFDNFIKKLTPGDIIDSYIIKVMKYGIFCDIGCGIVALLPTNNISVTHIVDADKTIWFNHRLKVVVEEITEDYKIQLTHKELLGTWEEEASKFNEDDVVRGTVLSIEDYGVFIRISQNLSGLAEIPSYSIEVGDTVSVRIVGIKPESMKIKMLIIEKLESVHNSKPEYMRFEYKIKSGHIKDWVYSTPTAKKQIESHF